MQARIASGAGYRPRVCFFSIAGATLKAEAIFGFAAVPPGMR